MIRTALRRNTKRVRTVIDKALPAPIEGWDANSALANMKPTRAVVLENWFPQPGWVEVRRGCRYHASGVGTDVAVETLAVWQGPSTSAMFAAASGTIYDVTASGGAVSSYTGATVNRWQWVNFTNPAGSYLWMCNGTDDPVHYNGSAWANPSITGITATSIIGVISHKKRLWFVLANSTKGAYLDVDAIAGAASEFEFGSNFTRGGYLLAIATWTRDGGAGVDDYLVAVSSRGQAALYSGTDPSDATAWSLVGVFDIPTPLGRRCFTKYGGDLLILTVQGLYPLSQLLAVDQSQARRVAVSEAISQKFAEAASLYADNWGWEVAVYPRGTRLIVNVPVTENGTSNQYVMNTLTGAWCKYTGWNANTFAVYEDNLYFAGQDSDVYRADVGRADVQAAIVATGQAAYTALGTARIKRASLLRPLVTTSGDNRPSVGVAWDFEDNAELSAVSSNSVSVATFDSSVFDVAVFPADEVSSAEWTNVSGMGQFASIKFVARTGVADTTTSGVWGSGLWGAAEWGTSSGSTDEIMRIQGFVLTAEVGEYL